MSDTGGHGPRLVAYLDELRGNQSNTKYAAAIGLDDARISAWRRGGDPSLDHLRQIADSLNLPLSDVLIIAGYATADDFGGRAPAAPRPPSLVDALETDPTLTDAEREGLRVVVGLVLTARDGASGRRSARL